MMKEYSRRAQRIAQEMQKQIAISLQRHIKDPRISMATISGVNLSSDLTSAIVLVTFNFIHQNNSDYINSGIRILNTASGFIRSKLSKSMHLRIIPTLTFTYDEYLVKSIHMHQLITNLVQKDQKKIIYIM
ncbi:30S ribosome-binding factor RbfA [Candidatus Palibaumannia cicadellinicola]|uniref:Ribosome-binding factor A n=1 Tax=Candidatus Palibaumannia cicadellinicola TaxID=186490 RepID=A0A0K2BLT4_9GAMM|nr:30S ribosome-binding factor RbfA [Candidatus Baumannia cicadellinicola]AKZ66152.1 Ribosome-binding factor A [Candidatus Baumannia cicadellinicola]